MIEFMVDIGVEHSPYTIVVPIVEDSILVFHVNYTKVTVPSGNFTWKNTIYYRYIKQRTEWQFSIAV